MRISNILNQVLQSRWILIPGKRKRYQITYVDIEVEEDYGCAGSCCTIHRPVFRLQFKLDNGHIDSIGVSDWEELDITETRRAPSKT